MLFVLGCLEKCACPIAFPFAYFFPAEAGVFGRDALSSMHATEIHGVKMRRQKIFKKYERERDPQIAQDVLLVAALLSMDWTSGRLLLSGLLVFLPLRLVVVMVAAVVTGVASPSAGTEKCTSSVLPACSNGSTGGMGWVAAERLAGSVVVGWAMKKAAAFGNWKQRKLMSEV
ncbi:hypothetical protein V6N12_065713 [Hibiscus sabdariffa]|uniref:Uncharacterized protein n=1 Tax=Hibiscus sabdariffa TaxID=183260 RepID=A0ABR2G9I3_9ROSI